MKLSSSMLAAALALAAVQARAGGCPGHGDFAADRAAVFAQADADGSGTLTPQEFATFKTLMEQRRTERMFQAADTNGDGVVTQEELAAAKEHHRGGRKGKPDSDAR